MVEDEVGSSAIEAGAVTLVLATLTTGLALAAYLVFARAFIEFEVEQSLYCLAEKSAPSICRRRLERRLATFLPWGKSLLTLTNQPDWKVEVRWTIRGYQILVASELSEALLLRKKALSW